jgi:hypothetical protein
MSVGTDCGSAAQTAQAANRMHTNDVLICRRFVLTQSLKSSTIAQG